MQLIVFSNLLSWFSMRLQGVPNGFLGYVPLRNLKLGPFGLRPRLYAAIATGLK
jgi:hypothetical protein